MLKTGISFESQIKVSDSNTAIALGSGNLPVFATPAMVALMENAAMQCVAPYLEEGQTTVGSQISVSHIRPSAVGAEVSARATLTEIDGRRLVFDVQASDQKGEIGNGTHTRFIVGSEKFMSKL